MEKIEELGNGISLIVSKEHKFGTDAILLADFARAKPKSVACDLGTGCGIIPFVWHSRGLCNKIYGVEIQQEAAEMAQRSVVINKSEDKINILHRNLKELKGKIPFGSVDVVTCNPPYKAPGAGIESKSESDRIARFETLCTVDDICISARNLLKSGGTLCMCMRPERLTDLLCSMRNVGLEPKRLRMITQRKGCSPWLFLVEGQKDANPNIVILPELTIENDDGNYSNDMLKVYGMYKERFI